MGRKKPTPRKKDFNTYNNIVSTDKTKLDLPSAKNYRILFTIISWLLIFMGLTRPTAFGRCGVLFLSAFATAPALMFHYEVKKMLKEEQNNFDNIQGHKPKKDKFLITYLVLIIISLATWLTSCTSDDTSNNSNNVETTTSITTTTEPTTIAMTTEPTTTTEDITTMPTVITVAKGYENKDNLLMTAKVNTAIIPNYNNDTRGYINLSKDDFSKITEDNYLEFCRNVVYKYNESYNYFTIDFGDGTGICYSGCYIYDASYGNLDDTGAIDEKLGSIEIDIESNEVSSDTFTFALVQYTTTTVATTTTTPEPTTKVTTTTTQEVIQQNDNQSRTVYITPTGKKYHYDSNCNGGTYNPSTLDDALSLGLTPCKKCAGD